MTYLRIRKRISLYWKLHKYSDLDWLIFFAVMTGIFLPVRLVWWNLFSHSWGTNLGIMSAVAVIMFVLVTQNKLGAFGRLYHRQMIKIASHKIIGLELILVMIFNIAFWWGMLYLNDYGEQHQEEINIMNAIMVPYHNGLVIHTKDGLINTALFTVPYWERQYVPLMTPSLQTKFLLDHFVEKDPLFFAAWLIKSLNTNITGNWGTHFSAVFLIEELEGIGLWLFYRRVYLKKVGHSWKELGMFDREIKRFIWRDKRRRTLVYALTHKP